jgi:RNA polymerase sigma-70 factor, ECF subfamily
MASEPAPCVAAEPSGKGLQRNSVKRLTFRLFCSDCSDSACGEPNQPPVIAPVGNSAECLEMAIPEAPENSVELESSSRPAQERGRTRIDRQRNAPEAELKKRFERDVKPQIETLHSVARQLTLNSADADDLLQDTLIKAYARFHTFEANTHLKAWLVQIMRNTWIDYYRRDQRRPPEHLTGEIDSWEAFAYDRYAGQVGVDGRLLGVAAGTEVRQALQALPEHLQRMVFYAYVEGFRYREIAEIEDIPIGTVMSRIYRARRRLKEMLVDSGAAAELIQVKSRDESTAPTELAS